MTRFLAILLLCATADAAPRPPRPKPPLALPAQVEGDVGKAIKVRAKTAATVVRWVPLDKGLSLAVDTDDLKDQRLTYVTADAPGEYRLLAYTSIADVPTMPEITVVSVHGAQPPPKPEPTPAPDNDQVKRLQEQVAYWQTAAETSAKTVDSLRQTVADRDATIAGLRAELERLRPQPPPGPAPVVTSRNLWIVTIDDKTKRTKQVSDILTNMPMWAKFEAAGHDTERVDASNQKQVARFKDQLALNGGMPCVVLMIKGGADNGVWLNRDPDDMKLPLTPDGWAELIKRYSGK